MKRTLQNRAPCFAPLMKTTTKTPTNKDLVLVRPTIPATRLFPPSPSAPPSLLEHYVASVRERIRMTIERKRAEAALPTLRLLTEQAKLAAEYQHSLNVLQLADLEKDVRQSELLQEQRELAAQRRQTERLASPRVQKELLTLQLDIAMLKRQIREQRKPNVARPELTADQQRELKKRNLKQDIERLRSDEADAIKPGMSELETRRIKNMYAARRDELTEQLEKYL